MGDKKYYTEAPFYLSAPSDTTIKSNIFQPSGKCSLHPTKGTGQEQRLGNHRKPDFSLCDSAGAGSVTEQVSSSPHLSEVKKLGGVRIVVGLGWFGFNF